MKRTLIALAALSALTACGFNQDLDNLPVRNGPQQVSPYDTLATNPTIFNGGIVN